MHLRPFLLLILGTCSLAMLGGCSSGTDADDDRVVIEGVLVDEEDAPVINARVTINGVEAETTTDSQGQYRVKVDKVHKDDLLLTAAADGKDVLVEKLNKEGAKSLRRIRIDHRRMLRARKPNYLQITSPVDGAGVVDDPCGAEIGVHGVVGRLATGNARMDLVVLIDASGSTSRSTGSGGSIFAMQIESARQLADRLGNGLSRMAVVSFNAVAVVQQGLTDDTAALHAALDALEVEGPAPLGAAGSGTDFSAALSAAGSHFAGNPLVIEAESTTEPGTLVSEVVPTRKIVVLLSDGVPTLPVAPGLTQEQGDIDAALEAAEDLAGAGIMVHTFAVGVDTGSRTLTTMPTISHLTGGDYEALADAADLPEVLVGSPLVGVGLVVVESDAFPGESWDASPAIDGLFSVAVPVATGSQTLTVTAYKNAKRKKPVNGLTRSVTIHAANAVITGPQGLAETPVASRGFVSPYGVTLNATSTFPTYVKAQFPDLHESIGTQVFAVLGTGNQTLTAELVARDAGWRSTIGMLELTAAEALDLSASVQSRFANATNADVLFDNSVATWGNAAAVQWATGVKRTTRTATGGNFLVFFVVPNGTLAQGQAGAIKPYFTYDPLSPGAFDQFLSFHSAAGRGSLGSTTLVVAEDISLVNKSDRDWWDIGFSLTGAVPALTPSCPVGEN